MNLLDPSIRLTLRYVLRDLRTYQFMTAFMLPGIPTVCLQVLLHLNHLDEVVLLWFANYLVN